jgi:hypothetical protein
MAAGIYSDEFDFNLSYAKAKKPLFFIGLAALVILVVFLLLSSLDMIKQKPLEMHFAKGEISADEQTTLYVTVTNTGATDASDALLVVEAADRTSIAISPAKAEIGVLEKSGSRTLEFLVNPVNDVWPGKYIIKASFTVNGRLYEKQATLTVS